MKKKNLFGWLAMTAMLVGTGCSTDEVVNNYSPENAIQFGTYVGRDAESRGHITSIDKLASEGFGVFAYYTQQADFSAMSTANFMCNQQVTSTSGSETEINGDDDPAFKGWSGEWTYTPVKYWPNNVDDKVSFFAYAPYSEVGDGTNFSLPTKDSKGTPSLGFTVGTDVEKHQDLLWAAPAMNKTKNSSTSPVNVEDKIQFDFKHALARIGFKAEVLVDEVNTDATGSDDTDEATTSATTSSDLGEHTTITITKVQLIGKFYTKGYMRLDNGQWFSQVSPTDAVTFELSNGTNSDFDPRTEDEASTTDGEGGSDTPSTGTTTPDPANVFKKGDIAIRQLNNEENYIMIIPQNMTDESISGTDGETLAVPGKIKVYVEYEVFTDADKDGTEGSNDSKIINKITSDEFALNFEQGKAYSLNLHLGMTSVKFTATAQDWDDQTGKVVNVPINTTASTPDEGGETGEGE